NRNKIKIKIKIKAKIKTKIKTKTNIKSKNKNNNNNNNNAHNGNEDHISRISNKGKHKKTSDEKTAKINTTKWNRALDIIHADQILSSDVRAKRTARIKSLITSDPAMKQVTKSMEVEVDGNEQKELNIQCTVQSDNSITQDMPFEC
ncbi:hypothetical protein RFI_23405, partial [Reticulomyxa filosa]